MRPATTSAPTSTSACRSDLPPGYDALQFAEQNIAVFENPDQVEGMLPEGIDVDSVGDEPRHTTLGGETAYEVQYGLTTPEAEVAALQVFAVHEGAAYVGTYTADRRGLRSRQSEDLRHILETWEWD